MAEKIEKILFDSHAHINHENFSKSERAALIARIENSAVAKVVDVGYNLASSKQSVLDAQKYPWIYAAVGVHPHDAEELSAEVFAGLRALAAEPANRVVALGEIGLDYYRDLSPRPAQKDAFKRQIALALELGLPIIIHDRESEGDTLKILLEEGAFEGTRILFHCFSGDIEVAKDLLARGATISFAGQVTFKNAQKTVEAAREIPLENMLIETDSPYLSPEPFRGTENDSTRVELVAGKIAEIRGISYEEVAEQTRKNAERFFGIAN